VETPPRRVVTGHDAAGRVLIDGKFVDGLD
jgi:hypothetical protein